MMKWKYCITMIIISMLFTQSPVLASAKDDSVHLVINGVDMSNAKAYKHNDTIYIPFRAVFESLGIPFHYDTTTHSISYNLQGEYYSINIQEEIVFTPDGGYQLLIPLLMIHHHTYIPQEFVMNLLRLEVNYNKENNKLLVNSLDKSYDETISSLTKSYYERDIPAFRLFTYDANPYGTLDDLYSAPNPIITKVLNTQIGTIKYNSISEAVVTTSQLSTTLAVTIFQERELHFRKEGNLWKISKINPTHLQIELLDDIESKAAALMGTSPDDVEKVLSDLRNNYDALKGNDVEAAINTYSPLYIDEWNQERTYSWEAIVEHSITYPSTREDLLEAKVIYIDDNIAVVYVKILFSELPQTYGGLYDPGELEEPYEYREVLYLDHTDGERWTFYEGDPLDLNY